MDQLIPNFQTKAELISYLKNNKSTIIAQKKATIKHADAFSYAVPVSECVNEGVNKGVNNDLENATEIKVEAIINTTNFLDSHNDLHVKGIWSKSLKENKSIMHLQEHKMAFDKIIADGDKLKAYTKDISWSSLGYDYEGKTEALIFSSIVTSKRNPFMFNQYKDGNVKNHSVGMYYVKLELAVDSDDEEFKKEKETFDTYYPMIANKSKDIDFFWVVKEAKVIEGSAVPVGSNTATPTQNIEAVKNTSTTEPSENDTQKTDYFTQLLKQIKIN